MKLLGHLRYGICVDCIWMNPEPVKDTTYHRSNGICVDSVVMARGVVPRRCRDGICVDGKIVARPQEMIRVAD